jgi:hypothetical protein
MEGLERIFAITKREDAQARRQTRVYMDGLYCIHDHNLYRVLFRYEADDDEAAYGGMDVF